MFSSQVVISEYHQVPATAKWTRRFVHWSERAVANPFISYALIAVLQLRLIWNIWKYADLTSGDSSYYFVDAASWAHGFHENIVYYPLYDAFWGSILAVVHDVYAATILHRVIIVFAAALLILALTRSLLGPALGLLVAVWWTVLPTNYDPLYEVHLFGVLPLVLVFLVIARAPNRTGLGWSIAILLASAVLVRSELVASALILAAAAVIYEVRESRSGGRKGGGGADWRLCFRCYLLPLAGVAIVIFGAYARSHVQGHEAIAQFKEKEEVNFCESYAVSYQQRHPTRFTGNPFTECATLAAHDFGRSKPTLLQATVTNPRAVAGFAAWNAQLLPGGMQVGMLGATAFENDPGFRPVSEDSILVMVLSIALVALIAVGMTILVRQSPTLRAVLDQRGRWICLVFAAVVVATLIVALTTRPWSEYIYGLTITGMVLAGISAGVIIRRVGAAGLLAPISLVAVLALVASLSSHYHSQPRPLHESVEHLEVARSQLQRPGSVLLAQEGPNEICNYLAYSYERLCEPVEWDALRPQIGPGRSLEAVLDENHVTAIYADSNMLADPLIGQLIDGHRGWLQARSGGGPSGPWSVILRRH